MQSNKWKDITRKYLGGTWVTNEMAVQQTMTKQISQLPVSVAQARAQVQRLQDQSRSRVKKGHGTAKK